jgi:hypothetical protein
MTINFVIKRNKVVLAGFLFKDDAKAYLKMKRASYVFNGWTISSESEYRFTANISAAVFDTLTIEVI